MANFIHKSFMRMEQIDQIKRSSSNLYEEIVKSLSSQSSRRYGSENIDLHSLNIWRQETLPKTLRQRLEEGGKCFLNKDELSQLIDWKLAIGVFRPLIPKLIASNSNDQVIESSKASFDIFLDYVRNHKADEFWKADSIEKRRSYEQMVRKSFNKICELRGVGPATASLILSLMKDILITFLPPYFSDEAFLFYISLQRNPKDIKIKYTIKEYVEEYLEFLLNVLFTTNKKSNTLDFQTLERAGWALKMYDTHKGDTLADIVPSIKTDTSFFDQFCREAHANENEKPPPKKRKV